MATFKPDAGEIEIPLLSNGSEVTDLLAKLIAMIEDIHGVTNFELVGLREGSNGEWSGVFRKKAETQNANFNEPNTTS